jgi:hypothetical protein
VLRVTESPAYLHHDGLPVVALWGLGFDDRPGTAAEALDLVAHLKESSDPHYRATVVGGTPFHWRTLQPNARTDSAWADYYCSLDVISPWTVGAYATAADVDHWQQTMADDMARAAECGADYMPVVYPGHSYHNPDPTRPFNEYPRQGGRLYWHQVYRAIETGATMIYNAMFDEVDEGTAMFKVAATSADVPVGVTVVTLDVDGECLPSDWYLALAGAATRMLRGDTELSGSIPIVLRAGPDCVSASPVRLRVRTTSDWTTVDLEGIDLGSAALVSASRRAEQAELDETGGIVLTQHLDRANAGRSVEMVVDLRVTGFESTTIGVTVGRGHLGRTKVEFLRSDGSNWVVVDSIAWSGVADGDENAATFDVPVEPLEGP